MLLPRSAFLLNPDRFVPTRNSIGKRAQSNVSPTVFNEFNACAHVQTLDSIKKLKTKTKTKKLKDGYIYVLTQTVCYASGAACL